MAKNFALNGLADLVLRTLQVILAVIVMGTDGHAIHVFHGHAVYEQTDFGNFYTYEGVPNAWGFLMFCAAWTILAVIFHFIAAIHFADKAWVRYTRVGVEAVAVLSWLAGFVTVAVNIGSNTCPLEENGCGSVKAATVFGAFEWLLFVITASLTVKLIFGELRQRSSSKPWTYTVASAKPETFTTFQDHRILQSGTKD